MSKDPARRVNSIKGIATINMFVGTLSLLYHIWSFVWAIKEPKRITNTGQTEVVVYIGIVSMHLISLILIWVSWNLIRNVGLISSKPVKSIQASKTWKRMSVCFLTFFIIALMILVLSSGRQVHKGVIQNYMAFLLIIISFTIFGIYYVGSFIREAERRLEGATAAALNNVAFPDDTTPEDVLENPEFRSY